MSERRISRKELAKQNRKQNRKRRNMRTLLIIAVTAALVYITGLYGASLAYLGDFVSSGMTWLQIGGGFPAEGDFSTVLQAENMGSGLAVLTQDSLDVYSPTAKKVFSYSHSMKNPVISSSANRSVIYEANRTSLKVANNHSILFQQEMANNIIHACISDSNRIAVTTRSDSYNGEVSVYNYNMDKRFTWYCATGFPIYSVLSDSGRTLAVTTVQTVDGILQTDIFVIDAAKGGEKFRITSGDYPRKLIFLNDNKLLVAYSDSVELWDTAAAGKTGEYLFSGDSLLAVENADPYIALVHGGYSRGSSATLVLLGRDFSRKFTATVPENVKDISVSRSRVYVLGRENLYEYDYAGNLMNTSPAGALSRQLVTWNGTMLIDSTSISKMEKTSK